MTAGHGPRRTELRLGGLSTVVAGAAWVLVQLGDPPLGMPLRSPAALHRWLVDADAAVLAAELLRLAGLGMCAYLVIVLVPAAVASAAGWGRAAAVLLRVLPPFLRRACLGGAGLTLVTGTMVPAVATAGPTAAGEAPDRTAVMVKLDEGDPGASAGTTTTTGDPAATVDPTTTSAPTTTVDPPTGPSGSPARPADEAGPDPDVWVVAPGDSLWSIAAATLEASAGGGTPAAEEAVARYWRALVAANRDRLAAPGQPDLIFPGQEVVLPVP